MKRLRMFRCILPHLVELHTTICSSINHRNQITIINIR